MGLKLILAVGLLGLGIGYAVYHFGFVNAYKPTLDTITAPLQNLIPQVQALITHIQQNPLIYAMMTAALTASIGFIFNSLYKRAKQKTEQAAQAKLNEAKIEMANIQQSTLTLNEENQQLKNKVLLYQQSNLDKTQLLDKISLLEGNVSALETERNQLIEAKNAAWSVARKVEDTLEKSKQVP